MANELELYYTSGDKVTDAFDQQPRFSIGGYVTASQVAGNVKSLFGTVSANMLSIGKNHESLKKN